jgi:hypothetical protein
MNMVNKTYAIVALRNGPMVEDHLAAVFRPIYGRHSRKMVREIAKYMGRHVALPPRSRR